MNFVPELSAFQGAIISADNVHQFSRVTARGGHEDEILNILSRLFSFLQEKRYITKEGVVQGAKTIMRKLTFYIILNGDFPVLEELVELPGIDMAIWTIPTIPKCLVCEMIWGLHMGDFLYETIAMSYPTLAIQVLKPFVNNIKHYSPKDALQKIKLLAAACYRFVCRLIFLTYEDSYLTMNLSDAYELFLRIITYFVVPPNEARLNNLSEDESYKFKGNNLRTLLNLILECLNIYTAVEAFDPEGFRDIYLWTIKPENIKTESISTKVCDSPDEKVQECLGKLNTALLDKCKSLVMDVSVDIFCAWSEYDEGGKCMQQSIGELCYLLHSKLAKISSLADHPISEMLLQISCKPEDIHDLIRLADQDTVIENINKDSVNRSLWLQVALNKEDLLQQTDLIQCLISNVQYIEQENCNVLLKKIIKYTKENDSTESIILQLGVKLFTKCDTNQKHEAISELFTERTFTNKFETSDLESMTTEIFNKLIASPSDDISEVLNVFIQNPYKTYTKIINCATENFEQCDIMLSIIKLTEQYSSYFYQTDTEPCIIKIIQDFSQDHLENDSQKSNFIHFIVKLKEIGIIPGVKLLLLHIMPNLHRALVAKNARIVSIQLLLLDTGFDMDELVPYRAPLLAMIGQVMEVIRWNIKTYTGVAVETLEQAIQLQIKFFNTYGDFIPDREFKWLKGKLKNLEPLNMYYFRRLWDPPGSNYLEIVSDEKDRAEDKLTLLLSKILIQTTAKEWSLVWDSLGPGGDAALNAMFNGAMLISAVERGNRTDRSRSCLHYCLRNLLVIIKDKFLKEPLTDAQVEPVLVKLAQLINTVEENDVDDLSSACLSFLSYIFERKSDYNYDVTKFRDKIQYDKFRDMVNQLLSHRNISA